MKRVSFNVAKAIKEAGYPQWSTEEADNSKLAYDCEGELWEMRYFDQNPQDYYTAPYTMEVWFWLWREKKLYIDVVSDNIGVEVSVWGDDIKKIYEAMEHYLDPEEAIISTIEYLCENNLIK